MDRDDRVLPVQLAGQHRADLGRLNVAAVRIDAALEVGHHVLALPGPLEEHLEVVRLAAQRRRERAIVFEPAPTLLGLLGVGGIFPEIRRGDRRFDFRQFALQAGLVKAPSATQWRVP
jgi:hypothetical protein